MPHWPMLLPLPTAAANFPIQQRHTLQFLITRPLNSSLHHLSIVNLPLPPLPYPSLPTAAAPLPINPRPPTPGPRRGKRLIPPTPPAGAKCPNYPPPPGSLTVSNKNDG
ncbi:hypothetical protein DFH27DRAFT_654122 [Peziza echinospora]|nr:hypothetical protein DFH27DRAFT_654122 [Peziza echinospora]